MGTAANRFLVHESVAAKLTQKFFAAMGACPGPDYFYKPTILPSFAIDAAILCREISGQ